MVTAIALMTGLLALAIAGVGVVEAAQTPGPNGTYECWDRCVAGVGCNTGCYLDDDWVTCADYSPSCNSGGSGGGTVGQHCGDGLCYYDPYLGVETACNCAVDCHPPPNDRDLDGVPDSLEAALAARFFPHIYVTWPFSDVAQFYTSYANGRIPYTVTPIPAGRGLCAEAFQCLEIKIGLAYNWDCGDNPNNGVRNDPVNVGQNGHRGDSELYMAYVARKAPDGSGAWGVPWSVAQGDAGQWRLIMDFTSAHFLGGGVLPADSSKFAYYGSTNLAIAIVASEGKHANYHTLDDCEGGGVAGADHCELNYNLRSSAGWSAAKLKNMGEGACHDAIDTTIPNPNASAWGSPSGSYDVWSWDPFGTASSYTSTLGRVFDWTRQHACAVSRGAYCANIMELSDGALAYLYHWRTFDNPASSTCYCP